MQKAIVYMIISSIGFALMNTIIKYLGDYHAFQIVFFRSLGSLVFTNYILLSQGISILGNQRKLLVARGFVGVTSMLLFFMGLKYMPVGTAVSIRYIGPIFAAIFGLFILGERIFKLQWLCFVMAFMGVVVLKGFDLQAQPLGVLLTIASAVFSGMVYTLLRKIGSGDHPVVVVNYFMTIAALVGLIGALFYWKTPVGIDWLLLGSLGIFGYVGQLFMTKAFGRVESNQIAPFKYIEVVFTLLIGVMWFGDRYTWLSLSGIVLIFLGLIFNVYIKNRQTKKLSAIN